MKSIDLNPIRWSDFLDKVRLEKPITQVYEEINIKCNNFLKTQKGLQYLLMKYPKLSPEQAIKEYYLMAIMYDSYGQI